MGTVDEWRERHGMQTGMPANAIPELQRRARRNLQRAGEKKEGGKGEHDIKSLQTNNILC